MRTLCVLWTRFATGRIIVTAIGLCAFLQAWAFQVGQVTVYSLELSGSEIHEQEITERALNANAFSVELSSKSKASFNEDALKEIKNQNRETDTIYFFVPKVHFDDDSFIEGNKWLSKLRRTIVRLTLEGTPTGIKDARYFLGTALHTVQDFYAHSTWVNSQTGDGDLAPLGRVEPTVENLSKTSEEIGNTCTTLGGPVIGLGQGSPLISGHFEITQSPGNIDWTVTVGELEKCIHGGLVGVGLHKDKPGRDNYEAARSRAVLATQQYVSDILSDIANQSSLIGPDTAICGLLGAKCANTGLTKVSPTSVITGLKNPSALTMIGDNLYFGELSNTKGTQNTGTFNRVTKLGVKTVLATGTAGLNRGNWGGVGDSIDATSTHLYFSYGDYDLLRIEEMTLSGSNRRLLKEVSGGSLAGALKSTAGTDAYYVEGFFGLKKLRVGGAESSAMSGFQWPRNYIRDGANLYFVDVYSRNFFRLNLSTGGTPTLLISGNPIEGQAHVNTLRVFLGMTGVVKHLPKAGGAVTTVNLSNNGFMRGADSQYIYFSTADTKQIRRIPISGGAEQVLVENSRVDSRILFNGGKMYWLDISDGPTAGKIRVLPVPP